MNTTTEIDYKTFTIRFERMLAASREDAFDAWTRPEEVAAWWDPDGTPLVSCKIDLRPGGAFTFVHVGHAPPFTGTYRVIERPSQLVFDALGSEGTVLFESRGGSTLMRVSIHCASAEHLDHFIKLGVANGTARTLDNLAGFLS